MRQMTRALSGAIAAVAMVSAEISPAAAFTLPSPAATEKAVLPEVEKTYWCRWGCGHGWGGGWGRPGWGYGRPGWGYRYGRWGYWGAGAVAAGVATGAVVGATVASSCWRRVVGPYGAHWVRVC
jgi:hypothetical protein